MRGLSKMYNDNKKIYVMHNERTGVKIECTKEYLVSWIARGFKVTAIKLEKLARDGSSN